MLLPLPPLGLIELPIHSPKVSQPLDKPTSEGDQEANSQATMLSKTATRTAQDYNDLLPDLARTPPAADTRPIRIAPS
ncbi:hypothetical protein GCM10009651_32620 [Microbacterium natoriense]